MGAVEAARMPIHTLLSGPAAGVTASAELGAMIGEPSLLTMDMGGTSTDISLVDDGRVMVSHDGRVGDFPLMMPVTAIEAIGAGGGSIAWMDGPVLKVGPRSAGAVRTGLYGKGGTAPTVSDAYLLCGYLSDDAPLAADCGCGVNLPKRRCARSAAALGGDTVVAAESVIAVATSNMLANALPFIARLGLEPGALTLMIYGGAGGIHGPLLAEEIGIGRVIVPRLSSVFCAFGCLVSDLLYDVVRTVHGMALTPALLRETYAELREQGGAWLAEQPGDFAPRFDHSADLRYAGQSFDVNSPVDEEAAARGDIDAVANSFHAQHQRLYGHASPGARTEALALRVRVRGELPRPAAIPLTAHAGSTVPAHTRTARFDGAWMETPIFAWANLSPEWQRSGPAIVEQETATVVIPPGFTVRLGRFGDLILERR